MDYTEKVVLITGASSGIGAATAIHLSKLSAKLALVGRNEINLKRIALYCEKSKGLKPLTITADLTIESDVERIVNETTEHYGKLDVLVNNAGVFVMGGIKKSTMEEYDNIMSTNMRSVYHLTMLATPHLVESKGCIVNVSSAVTTKPTSAMLIYGMSKAALDHFTKCLAQELAPDGVRVNSVNPGYVKTNIMRSLNLSEDQLEMITHNMINNISLKKSVEGDHVASLIAFLASDKAETITGTNNTIDAGVSLR